MSLAAKTPKEQRGRGPGRPFAPGTSGNPRGRPSGSRHKTTLAMEELLDGEAEKLTRKAIDLALAGDMVALRLCLDRTIPPRRDRPVLFALPAVETTPMWSRPPLLCSGPSPQVS